MSTKALIDETPPGKEMPRDGKTWRMGTRHLLYLVFYCGLICWFLTFIPLLFVGGLVGMVAVFAGLVTFVSRRRSTQQNALVAIIAVAAEREMPLAPALDAVSDQFTGGYRRKVRTLAHYLKNGVGFSDALDRVPGVLPVEAELLARVGSVMGNLAGASREAGATRFGIKPVWNAIARRIGYFLYVLYVIQIISGFLFYFIVPKLEAILRDFNMEPPAPTLFIIWLGDVLGEFGGLYAVLLLVESVVMIAVLASLTGWKRLQFPFVDRFLVRKHSALILRSLAWIVESGFPILRGLELIRGWYPSHWVRNRLSCVILDVEHGSDWVDSLVHRRLLRKVDAAVLESARRAGNLPWALRETALSGERRLAYRLELALQLLTPVVLLALGLLVGLLAVAYFAPLIKIIEGLL